MSQTTYLHYASFLISQHHQSMGHGQGHVYISNATVKKKLRANQTNKSTMYKAHVHITHVYHLCLKKWKKKFAQESNIYSYISKNLVVSHVN